MVNARLAGIDCGTNSIRLLIADVDGGRLRDVHRETRIVRLGQGVDATGEFAADAMARTRAALTDYAALLKQHGAQRVRMVATSAARDVANRDAFFAMTADVLGAVLPGAVAEVITGAEEAELSFRGAVGELRQCSWAFRRRRPGWGFHRDRGRCCRRCHGQLLGRHRLCAADRTLLAFGPADA